MAEETFFAGAWPVRSEEFFVLTITPFPDGAACTPIAFCYMELDLNSETTWGFWRYRG